MIFVNLRGGLGNQMFQYAFARSLQERFGDEVVFNMYYLKGDTQGRKFSLDKMNTIKFRSLHPMKEFFLSYFFKLITLLLTWKQGENAFIGNSNFERLSKFGLLVSRDMFKYFEVNECEKKMKYVDGYFQSWRYFDAYKEKIKLELKVTSEVTKENKKFLEKIESCESVCVHIRRGDYVSEKWSKLLNICSEEYYRRAMDYLVQHTTNPTFFIFSNSHQDIEWIKDNFRFDYQINFIDLNNDDCQELRLMYSCKHFIISNSTFSWWASYLSEKEGKITIAPSKWHNSNLEQDDLYIDEWVVLRTNTI